MKCPDCASDLVELKMSGGDVAHRCVKCGGFFIDTWTVNRLTLKQLNMWRRMSISGGFFMGGAGLCPLDGMQLQNYIGEAVPPFIPAKRCNRCGKWWFPKETLYEYKTHQDTKASYFKAKGTAAHLAMLLLPAVLVVMLVVGLGAGVVLIERQQQTGVDASAPVRAFSGTYVGGGRAIVSFQARESVVEIEYKYENETIWRKALVESEGDAKIVNLMGLEENEKVIVRIMGREFEFITR